MRGVERRAYRPPLVPDAAGVERIGQQAVEVAATERQPACPSSIRGEALLGTQSQMVRLGLHLVLAQDGMLTHHQQ